MSSLLAKAFTISVHCSVTAGMLVLMNVGPYGIEIPAVQVVAVHVTLLLGVWGPRKTNRWWWVPDPIHEIGGVALLFLIGIIEYLGIGIVYFGRFEGFPCETSVRKMYGFTATVDRAILVAYPMAEAFAGAVLRTANCTVDTHGAAIGPCDACGCEPCDFGFVHAWATALDAPSTTSVSDGLMQSMHAAGCTWVDSIGPAVTWTFIDRLWLCMVLLTTVGYGHSFVPSNPSSRQFTLVWALYGLFMFGAGSSVLGEALYASISALASFALRRMRSLGLLGLRTAASATAQVAPRSGSWRSPTPSADVPLPNTEGHTFTPPDIYYVGRGLYFNLFWFMVLNFGGAAIFWSLEDGMTISDAFYHCIMTATTVGLGDIAPLTQSGRAYGIVHMVTSVILLGSILSTILDALHRRAQSVRMQEMLQHKLDRDLLLRLDRDNNGVVGKTEFVLGMLESLGIVSASDYQPFLDQFAQLDRTGDGQLSRDDVSELLDANRRRARQQAEAAEVPHAQRSSRQRLDAHARDLVVPTFFACFGFLWFSTFGFVLSVAGLLLGLAVGGLLGSPPGKRSTYQRVIALLAASAACLMLGISLLLVFLHDSSVYLSIDPVMASRLYGALDAKSHTVPLPPAQRAAVGEGLRQTMRNPFALLLFVVYVAYFSYALLVVTLTARCCAQVMRECDQASVLAFERHGAAATGAPATGAPAAGAPLKPTPTRRAQSSGAMLRHSEGGQWPTSGGRVRVPAESER